MKKKIRKKRSKGIFLFSVDQGRFSQYVFQGRFPHILHFERYWHEFTNYKWLCGNRPWLRLLLDISCIFLLHITIFHSFSGKVAFWEWRVRAFEGSVVCVHCRVYPRNPQSRLRANAGLRTKSSSVTWSRRNSSPETDRRHSGECCQGVCQSLEDSCWATQ